MSWVVKGTSSPLATTTRGLDLLTLPTGTMLRLGAVALIAITGLRNPCKQIDAFQSGLLRRVVHKRPDGSIVRRAAVMGVVVTGGVVRVGDTIQIALPPGRPIPLEGV